MVTHTAVIPVSERAGIEQKRSPLLLILVKFTLSLKKQPLYQCLIRSRQR